LVCQFSRATALKVTDNCAPPPSANAVLVREIQLLCQRDYDVVPSSAIVILAFVALIDPQENSPNHQDGTVNQGRRGRTSDPFHTQSLASYVWNLTTVVETGKRHNLFVQLQLLHTVCQSKTTTLTARQSMAPALLVQHPPTQPWSIWQSYWKLQVGQQASSCKALSF
jgi:hypothetical protein